MVQIKQFIIYSLGLVAGVFCGKWAAKIASDTLKMGGSTFMDDKIMIPTNVTGGIELVVTIVVLLAAVELIKSTGLIK